MKVARIKAQFEMEGISIRKWAKARGYNVRTVYAVINGRLKGKRGIAHAIAVELGLKAAPKTARFAIMSTAQDKAA